MKSGHVTLVELSRGHPVYDATFSHLYSVTCGSGLSSSGCTGGEGLGELDVVARAPG